MKGKIYYRFQTATAARTFAGFLFRDSALISHREGERVAIAYTTPNELNCIKETANLFSDCISL